MNIKFITESKWKQSDVCYIKINYVFLNFGCNIKNIFNNILIICEVERTKLLIIIKKYKTNFFVWLYKHIFTSILMLYIYWWF